VSFPLDVGARQAPLRSVGFRLAHRSDAEILAISLPNRNPPAFAQGALKTPDHQLGGDVITLCAIGVVHRHRRGGGILVPDLGRGARLRGSRNVLGIL
jgi:hypothetical protein